MDKKNSEYLGKQMYGFGFQDSIIRYPLEMNQFIGEIGYIVEVRDHAVVVKFDSNPNTWWYPVRSADHYIIENEPPINLDELFNLIKQI